MKKKIKDIYPWILWGIVVIIIIFYIFTFLKINILSDRFFMNINESKEYQNATCPIEYSRLVCIDDKPVIGFYNPNKIDLMNISVVVPTKIGVDIYYVIDPLKSNVTETLVIFNSSCSVPQNKIRVHWCCEKCYTSYMNDPSEDIEVRK